jgi:hypothetical protein
MSQSKEKGKIPPKKEVQNSEVSSRVGKRSEEMWSP